METYKIPESLVRQIHSAKHIAILTGAGVSAESGLPTFREPLTGLWENYNPNTLANKKAFLNNPALVWGWYEWRRIQSLKAEPNAGHKAIAQLAKTIPKLTLITQNVDDLHERAGSQNVIHLHGSLHQPRCLVCGHRYEYPEELPEIPDGGCEIEPPRCIKCQNLIRPGVVWFGEELPELAWHKARRACAECDVLIVAGTSGVVQPAASLVRLAEQNQVKTIVFNTKKEYLFSDCYIFGRSSMLFEKLLSINF